MSVKPESPKAEQQFSAKLLRSQRITPETSREEVRHMVFQNEGRSFQGRTGQSIRILAPGQYGNKHHARYYTIADPERETGDGAEFAICVRRCFYVDEFNGEQYNGVASNYLCDLKAGDRIEFNGPYGLVFPVPADNKADILMIGMGTGIAPFRAYVRHLYEDLGGWKGKVRLFYGARSGLEMLYMNQENSDLANYYDEKTFKAFQAVSPRPHFDQPVALDEAIGRNAEEVWAMLRKPGTQVLVAGVEAMLEQVEKALVQMAGSREAWSELKRSLVSSGRWSQVLY